MISKGIVCIVLFVVTVTGSLGIQLYVNGEMTNMLKEIKAVSRTIDENSESLNDNIVLDDFYDMEKKWRKKESTLCLFINYTDVNEIGRALSRLEMALLENDCTLAKTEINLLGEVIFAFKELGSFSLKNIV